MPSSPVDRLPNWLLYPSPRLLGLLWRRTGEGQRWGFGTTAMVAQPFFLLFPSLPSGVSDSPSGCRVRGLLGSWGGSASSLQPLASPCGAEFQEEREPPGHLPSKSGP